MSEINNTAFKQFHFIKNIPQLMLLKGTLVDTSN